VEKDVQVPDIEIKKKLQLDNPWWSGGSATDGSYPKRRWLFQDLYKLWTNDGIRRAAILLGPRRVGKTVLLKQLIDQLIADGIPPKTIFSVQLDQPIYSNLFLEQLIHRFIEIGHHGNTDRLFIIFDEIQYLRDWQLHLKTLVDSYPHLRIIVSGSAASALRRHSMESGAGRFTDFTLLPLSFAEFVEFTGRTTDINADLFMNNIEVLNDVFLEYLQYGGFPEAALEKDIRSSFEKHIGTDILDRVLLRDLPSLYGISDPQELNRLFASLAYSSGQEINLENLSKSSNLSKTTIRRYLEYLEAAYLIDIIYRIDGKGNRFQRDRSFKVYLTNSSLRTVLYGPLTENDPKLGAAIETAYLSQLRKFYPQHSGYGIVYARWKKPEKEIDFIVLERNLRPFDVHEVKWTDDKKALQKSLEVVKEFFVDNPSVMHAGVSSRTLDFDDHLNDFTFPVRPTAMIAYKASQIGRRA
jgi:uncharacterized protein